MVPSLAHPPNHTSRRSGGVYPQTILESIRSPPGSSKAGCGSKPDHKNSGSRFWFSSWKSAGRGALAKVGTALNRF
ncbi:hypothetical protein CALCODRAFT_501528 [Calocera cornea HHB12733]|uniref:Uncharacterized protein n=1 Tax=Calocera cornea HHB12733 TaxID=1353952 RepID=A0A165DKL1_9BASI|nr:hypothetical protein CALCODRAFT_501528 [Calocera cornea HHB12733]